LHNNLNQYLPMSNFTNSNFSQKPGPNHDIEANGLLHGNIKIVKKYLDKLPDHCEKVSSQTLKRVIDFAKSYRVMNTKNSGPVEMHLN